MVSKLRDTLQYVEQEAGKLLTISPDDHMTLQGGLSIIRERARAALALPNPSAYMRPLYDSAYELRRAQKSYFRTRAQTDLSRCRVLESKFDELLDEVALNSCGVLRFRPVQPTLL